ncbi:ParB/RepB/Spo0J family partition protein [Ruminococcaceae bacterium OttesenSCG-928-I18]|nr:ParB/RepB/Spo0J family partition protein [Ruminococcaceae bacterium OttesenSCG-928-I18]
MPSKKGGLGRGLDSLFADTGGGLASQEKDQQTLPLRDIEPDREQPRKTFEAEALNELAKSIEDHGLLQPIVVRPNPAGGYKIVAGERRWRAARQVGLREIPAIVRDISDEEAIELALIENLQREDLDPVEEALGYRQLMERCQLTQEQAAEKLAKSRSAVANSLRILHLPDELLEMLKSGELSAGHAKAILSIPDDEKKVQAAHAILEEKLNVRQAESLAKKLQKEPREKQKKPAARPSIAAEVEISLRERLGTEVHVEYKEGQGKLTLGFYSEEQLRAFANLLDGYRGEKG